MLLLIDKPIGITSYDVIRRFKQMFPKGTKIGHSGTLDPMASGLLILGIDKDTKRLPEFLGADKTYITTIDFSKMSDTRDMDYWDYYEEYESDAHSLHKNGHGIAAPGIDDLITKLDSLIPKAFLPLTPFSAKKKNGKKLYELARSGQAIQESREMTIHSYKIINYNFPCIELELQVGSGTYIRSIGYWLGQQIGLGGILTSLRRTQVSNYTLPDQSQCEEWEGIYYTRIS